MIKVAIVEDQKELREQLESNVNDESGMCCVGAYADGESAIGKIMLLDEKPEVIIMDIDLPKMSGIECMEMIKIRHPKIHILMYTIFDTDDKLFEALKFGADGYLLKRDSYKRIVSAIRGIINGEAPPTSKEIAKKIFFSFREEKEPIPVELERLTKRQVEVLTELSKGYPYRAIGEKLNITIGTVRQHCFNIYKKLHVNNRIEATLFFNKFYKT